MSKMLSQRDIAMISLLRKNSRMTLTRIGKKVGMPISTVYERLKLFRAEGLRATALIDFARIGFGTRAIIAVKVEKDERKKLKDYFVNHLQVNTILRINNGYTFMVDLVCRDMREVEDFMDYLEERFRIKKKMLFIMIGEVEREKFLAEPELTDVMFGGDE